MLAIDSNTIHLIFEDNERGGNESGHPSLLKKQGTCQINFSLYFNKLPEGTQIRVHFKHHYNYFLYFGVENSRAGYDMDRKQFRNFQSIRVLSL